MTVTRDERQGLCDRFDELGPDAPTLCEGWDTKDLLVHLLVRERRPDAAAGIVIPFLRGHADQVSARIGARPFGELVQEFRQGPPPWTVWAIPGLGDRANVVEFFVHHEDVRRAQEGWAPRPEDPAREDALWSSLRFAGRLLFRGSPVGVVLRAPGREELVVNRKPSPVHLVGLPSEITLLAFGRSPDRARVVVEGAPGDVAAFNASPRGF